jgi:hypothetical protein
MNLAFQKKSSSKKKTSATQWSKSSLSAILEMKPHLSDVFSKPLNGANRGDLLNRFVRGMAAGHGDSDERAVRLTRSIFSR